MSHDSSGRDCGPFNPDEYEKLVQETFKAIQDLARIKGREYSGDEDRLANFRRVAARLDLVPEQVLAVYASKHWDAILTYVQDTSKAKSGVVVYSEPLTSRIDDLIVYLLLLKGMWYARRQNIQKEG